MHNIAQVIAQLTGILNCANVIVVFSLVKAVRMCLKVRAAGNAHAPIAMEMNTKLVLTLHVKLRPD